MILRAPRPGVLEWRSESPRHLAWLAVVDHCALLPVLAPGHAPVTWTRNVELRTVEADEPLALLGDDPLELAACLAAERRAMGALITLLEAELAALITQPTSPLRAQLLGPERDALTARLARLRASSSSPPASRPAQP